MQRTRVGVLRGGPSSEYDVSLKTGAAILNNLDTERYEPWDVFISRSGEWHLRGCPVAPARVLNQVDVVFNALHGAYGEDGTVQRLLDTYRIPYTGSGAFPSAVAMNKLFARQALAEAGVKMPRFTTVRQDDAENLEERAFELFRTFPQPTVIKPANGGSSLGVTVARTPEELMRGIEDALAHSDTAIIEEHIRGKEATCGIVDNFRGEPLYALLPVEICLSGDCRAFDYEAKYGGTTEERCPGSFSTDETNEVQRISRDVHRALGLRHYSRSDFIVSPRGVYFLEVNTLPGLTETSLVPKALDAVGCSLPVFLDHVITQARQNTA